jgi:hypothetical protein
MIELSLPKSRKEKRLTELELFARQLKDIQKKFPFKVSSRGWCYQLENENIISKANFDKIEKLINICRKSGYLPIDFVAEDKPREFHHIPTIDSNSPDKEIKSILEYTLNCGNQYSLDFWKGEQYFICMLVEKIDLVTLFEPICKAYHIPIANTRGWNSISQRDNLIKMFQTNEEKGRIPVLLYCGDFDPIGIKISEKIPTHLKELQKATNWNPKHLIFDRFGLNFDFIKKYNLTWIDNLLSGSGKKPDYSKPYIKEWIKSYGERKVEANALVVNYVTSQFLCITAIEKYLGNNADFRFKRKRKRCIKWFNALLKYYQLKEPIEKLILTIK